MPATGPIRQPTSPTWTIDLAQRADQAEQRAEQAELQAEHENVVVWNSNKKSSDFDANKIESEATTGFGIPAGRRFKFRHNRLMGTDNPIRETPTVSVTGWAEVEAVPDEARISLELTASGRSAPLALDAVRKRIDKLKAILDSHGVVDADQGQVVSVSEQRENSGGKWLAKGYSAAATVTAIVRETDNLGIMITEAVETVGPEVDGPDWRVSRNHPARPEAWQQAASESRAKAEAYTAALGLGLGEVLEIVEPGASFDHGGWTRQVGRSAAPMVQSASIRQRNAPESTPAIDLRPVSETIRASVGVRFAIETIDAQEQKIRTRD